MFLLNRFLQNPSRTRQLLYGQLPYHRYLLHRPVNFQHYCRKPESRTGHVSQATLIAEAWAKSSQLQVS